VTAVNLNVEFNFKNLKYQAYF